MKKITIFIGSPRKGATYQVIQEFIENFKSHSEIDFEYVFLKDYNLLNCTGCKLCFNKGEECCPLKDDRDLLLEKINNSDGIIFATPNYAFHVTALMKNFLDRIAFIFHRPRFFGKAFTAIVVQGIYGGASIVKYLESTGEKLGFNVSKGCCLTSLEPRTAQEQKKITQKLNKTYSRFYNKLMLTKLPNPSFTKLLIFRIARTSMLMIQNEKFEDYCYFKEKGWFESDYYYNVSLGPIKKLSGYFFDFLGKQIVNHRRNSK